MWRYIRCPECGAMILAKDNNAPCVKCAKVHKSARFNFSDPDSMIIERDPISFYEGGFRKGTCIPQIQVECMCNVGSFSEGTILIDKNHNRFQVCRDFEGRQQLVPLRS